MNKSSRTFIALLTLRFVTNKMPSGHKIFDWSPQSEIKLFHAILAVHRSQIDYDAVAKVFGESYLRILFCLSRLPK
jgi:hypothetical protein